jgi:hypothetical protein
MWNHSFVYFRTEAVLTRASSSSCGVRSSRPDVTRSDKTRRSKSSHMIHHVTSFLTQNKEGTPLCLSISLTVSYSHLTSRVRYLTVNTGSGCLKTSVWNRTSACSMSTAQNDRTVSYPDLVPGVRRCLLCRRLAWSIQIIAVLTGDYCRLVGPGAGREASALGPRLEGRRDRGPLV